ncbi:hypothetical protein CBR_g8705 [Chara braunii]|uniref:Uncharacterized protein n=1 Tax=Chara braunii TaxID=69332 RepID=A0A388KMW6_CHABU|nr:hypothetical protein CBR_g8705 [Chara braunii]|eukprot:GBG71283.1 hypothetical protein CBR_g8705 [Chara braunii]
MSLSSASMRNKSTGFNGRRQVNGATGVERGSRDLHERLLRSLKPCVVTIAHSENGPQIVAVNDDALHSCGEQRRLHSGAAHVGESVHGMEEHLRNVSISEAVSGKQDVDRPEANDPHAGSLCSAGRRVHNEAAGE